MIEISVIAPLFRAKYIAWLAFEGLALQEGIDFDWELIIAEEQQTEEVFGEEEVMRFKDRLEAIRCKKIEYIPLQIHISLGSKLNRLYQACDENSKLIFQASADQFSAKQRLSTLYALYEKYPEADYYVPKAGIVYDLLSDRAIVRDPEINIAKSDVAGTASKTSFLKKAGPLLGGVRRQLDTATWKAYGRVKGSAPVVARDTSDMWKYGLNTDGLNNISNRTIVFDAFDNLPKPLIAVTPDVADLNETIPEHVMNFLKERKEYIHLHKKMFNPLPIHRKD